MLSYVWSHGSLFYFHVFGFVEDCFMFTVADWASLIVRIKKWAMTFYIRYNFWTQWLLFSRLIQNGYIIVKKQFFKKKPSYKPTIEVTTRYIIWIKNRSIQCYNTGNRLLEHDNKNLSILFSFLLTLSIRNYWNMVGKDFI